MGDQKKALADGWRRRLPFDLFVCGMAVLVAQYFQRQPVDLEVVYHYDALSTGLQSVSLEYQRVSDSLRQARFSYGARPAGRTQRHAVSLPRGDYWVWIELRFSEVRRARQAARYLDGARATGDLAVGVSRRLVVRGEGQADVYL